MATALSAVKKMIKHRSALVIAGTKLGVPEYRLLRHDNSKLSDIEFSAYVERFELGINKPEHDKRAVAGGGNTIS